MSANVDNLQFSAPEHIEDGQAYKQSKDEADFVRLESYPPLKSQTLATDANYNSKLAPVHTQCPLITKRYAPGTLYGDCEVKTSIKSSLSTLEKLAIFNLNKKKGTTPCIQHSSPLTKDRHKFAKGSALARLLGNTYSTKKLESELINGSDPAATAKNGSPVNSVRRFGGAERFQKCSKLEDSVSEVSLQDFREDKDLSNKAFRTISRSLGKLWWRRKYSVDISTPDPEYKVSYLGNVLTGWAKGEGCVEKPLNTLWRNYAQNRKPDVVMRIKVCASGLKATTRQHGLTEYWANRITYCCAPKNYPRIFCWIYRHEGRKLKHELRCHAVLCSKESTVQEICTTLRENLDRALREFKRDKISRQNARLSLANSVYENPSLPRRKILLSVGGNNYRPPLERSKSAPKLMAIEEAIGEEDGEEMEETNEPEMPSCCQKDSFYPAMTLGRRQCRQGHSIRRTGKVLLKSENSSPSQEENTTKELSQIPQTENDSKELTKGSEEGVNTKSVSSLASDEDDLEKVLSYHDYDTNSPLAGELLSYFDMKIKPKTSSLTNLHDENIIFEPSLTSEPKPRPRSALSLDNLDDGSDGGGNCADEDEYDEIDDDVFYQQSAILKLLHRNSLRKMANLSLSSDDNSMEPIKPDDTASPALGLTQQQQSLDSDEGSISSGCETSSTVTTNMDDASLKYSPLQHQQQHTEVKSPNQNLSLPDQTHQTVSNTEALKTCSTAINFKYTRGSVKRCKSKNSVNNNNGEGDASDSEFSDESGYVEFQEQNLPQRNKSVTV